MLKPLRYKVGGPSEVFSKTHQSSLTLKGGPTAFLKPLFSWRRLAALGNMKANFHCAHLHNLSPQGTRDVPTALSIVFTTPSVPLVGDRNGAQTASLYGWRTIRGLRQQRSCSFLCGDKPQGHGGAADANAGTWGLLLMGTQGHNAGGLWNHLADTPTVLHQD